MVLVACAFFSQLAVARQFEDPKDALVYCPVQQKWVSPHPPKVIPKNDPLDEICSTTSKKSAFIDRLLQLSRTGLDIKFDVDLEDLFFSFGSNGEQVFAEFPRAPRPPDVPQVSFSGLKIGSNSVRFETVALATSHFSFTDLARPPTKAATLANYSEPRLRDLNDVSNSAQPRAPPFSL